MAPRQETVRVEGLRDFLRDTAKAEKETKKKVRDRLKEAGDVVREEASRLFAPVSAKTADGYRVRARVSGVHVEQSLRKTTGLRPDYGALQMRRALVPVLIAKEDDVQREMEKAADDLADIMEGKP